MGRAEGCLFEFLVVLLLVALNGLFAAAEIAVVALRPTQLQRLLDQGGVRARALQALRSNPERFLATVQVGVTVVSATAAAVGGASLAAPLAVVLRHVPGLDAVAKDVALALVVLLVSYLSVVFGELVPKSLALRHASAYALIISRPLLGLAQLAKPVVWLLTASSNLVLRPLGDRTTFAESRVSAEELHHLVREAAKCGTLDQQAGEIAARALEFAQRTVAEVMVPRHQVHALPESATGERLRALLARNHFSRLPVYGESLDDVRGYVAVKDVLPRAWTEEPLELSTLLQPPCFVPDTAPAPRVLKQMQQRHLQLAFVVDEHGALVGLVTLEDLLEELVGEMFSEHAPVESPIRREPNGGALVPGSTAIREVNRALGLHLEEGAEYSTLAGLCMAAAGGIPEPGRKISLPQGPTLEVLESSPTQVRLVRVLPAPAAG